MSAGPKQNSEDNKNHSNQGETRIPRSEVNVKKWSEGFVIENMGLRIPIALQFNSSLVELVRKLQLS